MITVLVAVVAVGTLLGGFRLLLAIYRKEKRKRMNRLLHRFSELGSNYDLTFSSQEILQDWIVGLDGINRKILVAKTVGEAITQAELIDLAEVKSCTVKKQYGNIRGGELRENKLEMFLESIVLHVEREAEPPIDIPFYHHRQNHIGEIGKLETKAKHWVTMLSKMIRIPIKKIA